MEPPVEKLSEILKGHFSPPVKCIVDTNVLADVFTCADLLRAYERPGATDNENLETHFRRVRARESLLLAIYFHEQGFRTMSLPNEWIRTATRLAPPEDVTNFGTHFTT